MKLSTAAFALLLMATLIATPTLCPAQYYTYTPTSTPEPKDASSPGSTDDESDDEGEASVSSSGDNSDPARETPRFSKFATEKTNDAIQNNNGNTAGSDVNPKSILDPKAVAEAKAELGKGFFSSPYIYAEYNVLKTDDHRDGGLDGIRHTGIVGGDVMTAWDVVLGAFYAYSQEDASSVFNNRNYDNEMESHHFTIYAGKNFWDWVNVGGNFTYGWLDRDTRGRDTTRIMDSETAAFSGFIGVAHSFGSLHWSTTPTYIYQEEYFHTNITGNKRFNTYSHLFTLLNTVSYDFTEQFTVALLANWNFDMESDKIPINPSGGRDDNWFNVGTKATYRPTQKIEIYAGFSADILNNDYDNYYGRLGAGYSF